MRYATKKQLVRRLSLVFQNRRVLHFLKFVFWAILLVYGFSFYPLHALKARHATLLSPIVYDRNGEEIFIGENAKGFYARPSGKLSSEFLKLIVQKEDRFFYYHPGVNLFSMMRGVFNFTRGEASRSFTDARAPSSAGGSSTITQQLVKTLLGNERERTWYNKLIESVWAIALELHASKNTILEMYTDTAYLGARVQGIREGALVFFNKAPGALSHDEMIELAAAIGNPSFAYPGTSENRTRAEFFARRTGIPYHPSRLSKKIILPTNKTSWFELSSTPHCSGVCYLTVDVALTETLRDVLMRDLTLPTFRGAHNGAIVVIRTPLKSDTNELLAVVGSPNPASTESGMQINMASTPRPIGSTAKPFIYAKAFEKGARPYTLVEDREYKYTIGGGYSFYPKNFDGQYRGTVTLHQALSNSLNVPSVKTLEFVGIRQFYSFLTHTLGFRALRPLEDYELGIALGLLEMDPITLAHFFTIFPREGLLKPLIVSADSGATENFLTMAQNSEASIFQPHYMRLITRILSDRFTGVEQFGLRSSLNLPYANYAVKTGTSRDFHDSWAVGYTPDFVVAVWIGNSDNTPLPRISGQAGAGRVWHDVMLVLENSPYRTQAAFNFKGLTLYDFSGEKEYGLEGDATSTMRTLMREHLLLLQPHQNDEFLLEPTITIPLRASENAEWFIHGESIGSGKKINWTPHMPGKYEIEARTAQRHESVTIQIYSEE